MDGLQETPWTFDGNVPVFVSPAAYVPVTELRPNGKAASVVQVALNAVREPWPDDNQPTWTLSIAPHKMVPFVVPIPPNARLVWGIHISHGRAQGSGWRPRPTSSPFIVYPPGHTPTTSRITLELFGVREGIVITQIYPDEKIEPPLWRARTEQQQRDSLCFWQTHGFIASRRNIRHGTLIQEPPHWWKKTI